MKRLLAVVGIVMFGSIVGAAKVDGRLATVRKAFVVPVDELGDDKPVAACFAEHLSKMTPIQPVETKDESDVIFRVKSHLPSATTRVMVGMMGGSPSADVSAELPDGTKLWADGAKLRRAIGRFGKLDNSDGTKGVECGLADELLDTLRSAMRQARDKK